MLPGKLPDEAARLRITENLVENLLVEAGAGSGKTTALVERMVSLIRHRSCKAGDIAAVTFTRKAAAELRQRFQVKLEKVLDTLSLEDPQREPVEAAVREIDDAFLGTIHAFCAKLLRERPLEAGLDPGFREVMEAEAFRLQRAYWIEFLERLASEGDPDLGELAHLGISASSLERVFGELVENPDVDFGFERLEPPAPDVVKEVRQEFEALLDRADELMPEAEPEGGWDPLTVKIRTWIYWRRSRDWSDPSALFDALAEVRHTKRKLTQKKWASTGLGKKQARDLQDAIHEFGAPGSQAAELVEQW
ncbi:MAG: UvrD-helicase domain-containing protein, partial [Longimicrobiales bacterium]